MAIGGQNQGRSSSAGPRAASGKRPLDSMSSGDPSQSQVQRDRPSERFIVHPDGLKRVRTSEDGSNQLEHKPVFSPK